MKEFLGASITALSVAGLQLPSANRFTHASDLCLQKWVGVEILMRKVPGALYLLLNLQSINNGCKLA